MADQQSQALFEVGLYCLVIHFQAGRLHQKLQVLYIDRLHVPQLYRQPVQPPQQLLADCQHYRLLFVRQLIVEIHQHYTPSQGLFFLDIFLAFMGVFEN